MGCGGFDYDCNTTDDYEYPLEGVCRGTAPLCFTDGPGWVGIRAECGVPGQFMMGCVNDPCRPVTFNATHSCR